MRVINNTSNTFTKAKFKDKGRTVTYLNLKTNESSDFEEYMIISNPRYGYSYYDRINLKIDGDRISYYDYEDFHFDSDELENEKKYSVYISNTSGSSTNYIYIKSYLTKDN